MIVLALSVLGVQDNDNLLSKSWFVDSAISNHMTSSLGLLKNIRPYHGSKYIKVVNGNNLSITIVGDITPTFNNTFVSPNLSDNLFSVGQLVENNHDVYFSHDSCHVQDQVSKTVIVKAPKVGRLFSLYISIPSHIFFGLFYYCE